MERLRAGTRPVTEGLSRDELKALLDGLLPSVANATGEDEERRSVPDEASDWTIENTQSVGARSEDCGGAYGAQKDRSRT